MTFKTVKAAALSAAALGAVLAPTAVQAATAEADATATILEQVTVINIDDLAFGTIVVDATGGTVGVAFDSSVTCGGALICAGTTTAASFTVEGSDGQTVDIGVDPTVSLVNLDGSGDTMTATLSASAATLALTGGSGSFFVGGSLTVGANQADGVYEGQFDVTADYQ